MRSEARAGGFQPQQRLHRLSWLFALAAYIRQFIVPLAAALLLGVKDDYTFWGLVFVLPLVVGAFWHQWVYRYGFSPRGLVIHQGLFFRNQRTIDYGRIENVDTERGILHRLLGVALVRVETSSGGKAEAEIRVLDMAAVQEMRERIFAQRSRLAEDGAAPAGDARPEEASLLRLGPGELVRYGLIDNRGLVVVAAAFGLLAQGGLFELLMERWVEPMLEDLPIEELAGLSLALQLALGVGTLVSLIAATRVLSILLALVTLHDFHLTRQGDDLRSRYGLLTRYSLTLRRPRIQAVHQTATLLHRVFRRVSLRVDLAGGLAAGGGMEQNGQAQARELWLAPLCTPDRAAELIRTALPQVRLENLEWRGLAPRARWRLFRRHTWLWLLVSLPPAVWFAGGWAAAGVVPVLPFLWLHAHLYVKYTGWALHDDFFVLRRGWLTRHLSVAPRNRIQSVALKESPFDRRYRMAGLTVDTAGANPLRQRLSLPYLDRGDAAKLAQALYRSRLQPADRPSAAPAG